MAAKKLSGFTFLFGLCSLKFMQNTWKSIYKMAELDRFCFFYWFMCSIILANKTHFTIPVWKFRSCFWPAITMNSEVGRFTNTNNRFKQNTLFLLAVMTALIWGSIHLPWSQVVILTDESIHWQADRSLSWITCLLWFMKAGGVLSLHVCFVYVLTWHNPFGLLCLGPYGDVYPHSLVRSHPD